MLRRERKAKLWFGEVELSRPGDKMPGTRRAVKAAASEGTAVAAADKIKVKVEVPAHPAANDFDVDLEKVCGGGPQDPDEIFSACDTPDDIHEDSSTELGEYELNYLHSLYQGSGDLCGAEDDAILPDAIAPPSLGAISGHLSIPASAGASTAPKTPDGSSLKPLSVSVTTAFSQPDTPPRGSADAWELETSPRSSSPVPAGPASKSSGKGSSGSSRKRKAPGSEPSQPAKAESSKQSKGPAQEPAKTPAPESDSEDDEGSASPAPSNARMFDGLEVRPEDDPLGLFSKDPATLTPEEQRILKKQRRLLKNRESAQLSRHRKKMHLTSLERQVEALKKEKSAMALRVQELTDENERLRKQLVAIA